MGNETLKKLTEDYATGQIDRYSYRQQRSRLIDEITGYDETNKSDSDSALSGINDTQNSTGNSKPASLSSAVKAIAIVVAVTTIVVAIILLMNSNEADSKQANTTSEFTPHSAENLINTFINYDDWTSERVSYFVAGWQNLTERQKQEAQQASWFQSLIENMKQRLIEQQKRAKSGSQEAQQQAQSILSLARLLGIRL